jgi:hypothetical protein
MLSGQTWVLASNQQVWKEEGILSFEYFVGSKKKAPYASTAIAPTVA